MPVLLYSSERSLATYPDILRMKHEGEIQATQDRSHSEKLGTMTERTPKISPNNENMESAVMKKIPKRYEYQNRNRLFLFLSGVPTPPSAVSIVKVIRRLQGENTTVSTEKRGTRAS